MADLFSPSLRRLLLLAGMTAASLATAQAQTGIGTTASNASAALDIVSTTKGVLLPRVALATGITSPATGLIVFQTGVRLATTTTRARPPAPAGSR